MTTPLTYWKSTYTVTVLTRGENPPNYDDLAALHRATTRGNASAAVAEEHKEVTESEMRALLIEQDSDPSFLIPEDEEPEGPQAA